MRASRQAVWGGGICGNPELNPYYAQQWGIKALHIDQLWSKPIISTKRPVIAILDTGVDINHPDLKDNIWTNSGEAEGEAGHDDDGNGFVDDIHGWDFVYNYNEMDDNNSHGTHVAGIAAASDNELGIVGANPQALIMAVKVLDDDGRGDLATIVKGIHYAAANGADVINMSLGSGSISNAMVEALENAYITSTIVASAGNDGFDIYNKNGLSYPAAYHCVIGVQATSDAEGNLAGFSNYDPDGPVFSRCDISQQLGNVNDPTVLNGINYEVKAPGMNIISTIPGGNYASYNGTSMSAPLVSGAISALKMVKDITNNTVLMSDLIHYDCDFAKVYAGEGRKSDIYLAGITIDDNIDGNNSPDGEADAGETLHLYPTLLNGWGESGDINMKLEVEAAQASLVTITNPDVQFGHTIDAYGHAKSANPFIVKVVENVGDDARIKFLLTYSDGNVTKTADYYMSVKNMSKIGGTINNDVTLKAGVAYHVTKNISIANNVTMTIEPGARLEFDEGIGIASAGKLVANGTPEKPIVFTGYKGAMWGGIHSHASDGGHNYSSLYRNENWTKFTAKYTAETPIQVSTPNGGSNWFYPEEYGPIYGKAFFLSEYLSYAGYSDNDYTDKQNLLTDPDFLTPIVLQLLADYEAYEEECEEKYATEGSDVNNRSFRNYNFLNFDYTIYNNPRDTIRYCKISDCNYSSIDENPACMIDCDLSNVNGNCVLYLKRCNFTNSEQLDIRNIAAKYFEHTNFVNNWTGTLKNCVFAMQYSHLNNCNYFNNTFNLYPNSALQYDHSKIYSLAIDSESPMLDHSNNPSYLGTSREDFVRPYLWEIGNAPTYGQIDLSNMPSIPYAEAHGILWKVVVNGKDCQDEFDDLSPLGVGTHRVELYFNRPMNKAKKPQVSYGVVKPFNQHQLDEGTWNDEGTVYTMSMKITGREATDGLNRFYVSGAEDNEYFECPLDSTRFNVMIQSAGSLSTGFAATPEMGRVELQWNNVSNDFSDAMGFNVYRFDENNNTIKLNKEILKIDTRDYIDYNVTPGKTYWYYYKVLSTDLREYDISNIVAAVPLTSEPGDANGSGGVDVSDVITLINFACNMNPKPFVFEAADINADNVIDILDVVGIIQKIINPQAEAQALVEATATYTVEDGVLYVESPVALAGVQVRLAVEKDQTTTVDKTLNGFEQTSAWLSDNDWLFLAYSLTGKTLPAGKNALLHIGDARLASICLSDANGKNVKAEGGEITGIDRMGSDVMSVEGIYTVSGRKLYGNAKNLDKLPHGVYIVNGEKVIK